MITSDNISYEMGRLESAKIFLYTYRVSTMTREQFIERWEVSIASHEKALLELLTEAKLFVQKYSKES